MTIYYCGLSDEPFADNNGTSPGTAYRGVAGFQDALIGIGNATKLVAGDELRVANEGNLAQFILLDCGEDVSGWGIDDTVQHPDLDWTGVVTQTNTDPGGWITNNNFVLICLDSAATIDDIFNNEGIENASAGGGAGDPITVATLTASSAPGISWDAGPSGTHTEGHIKIWGYNNAFDTQLTLGNYATLDGFSKTLNCLTTTAETTLIWFAGLQFTRAVNSGIDAIEDSFIYNIMDNVSCNNNGTYGFSGGGFNRIRESFFFRCDFSNNTSRGVNRAGLSNLYLLCTFINNVYGTFEVYAGTTIAFSIYHNNSTDAHGDNNFNCNFLCNIIDGDGAGVGINVIDDVASRIFFNRITNVLTGVESNAVRKGTVVGYNYFANTTTDISTDVTDFGGNIDGTTVDGYKDRAGNDFTLDIADAATGVNVELAIDALNSLFFTMGIPFKYFGLIAGPNKRGGKQ